MDERREEIIRKPNPLTLLLMDFLRRLEPGDKVSWAQVSEVIGSDVTDRTLPNYRYFYSAKNKLRRQEGINLLVLPGEGVMRCTDADSVKMLAPMRNKRTRTQLRMKLEEMANVDAANLGNEEVKQLQAEIGSARMLLMHSTKAYIDKEKAKIELNEPPPPPPLIVE